MAGDTVLAWHFLRPDGRLRNGDEAPPDGEWLIHDGPIVPCRFGLHASIRAIDALDYAPGPIVCRVECDGDIVHHDGDKIACRRRRILWRADGTDTLCLFARRQAQSVLHLWSAPKVVCDYLESGDESIRAAALDAAMDASIAAAGAAAGAAAWTAAAGDAASAARDAASAAAIATAEWTAARNAANDMLTEMLMRLEVRCG